MSGNYTCNTCHSSTAASNTQIINSSAARGQHPNAVTNVSFMHLRGRFLERHPVLQHLLPQQRILGNGQPSDVSSAGGTINAECSSCHGGNAAGGHEDHHERPQRSYERCGEQQGRLQHRLRGLPQRHGIGGPHDLQLYQPCEQDRQRPVRQRDLEQDSDLPTFNGSSADNTVPAGAVKNPGTPAGNCSNVYCHSIGNLDGAGAVVTAGGASFLPIAWNTGTIACDGCHGGSGNSYPTYLGTSAGSTTANSHGKHVDSSSLSCDYCHITTTVSTVVTVGAMTVIPGGQHLDRTEDVSFKLNGGVTGSYNAGKTCSNTYCHGANPSVAWGSTTDCASCHGANNNGDLSAGTTGHAIHYAVTTTATGLTQGDDFTTGYAYGCQSCHPTDQHAKGKQSTYSAATVSGTRITFGQYTATTTALNDADNFTYTNGSCATNTCHTNGRGAAAVSAVTWTGAKTGGCGVCHRAGGETFTTMTQTATRLTTTHAMHIANDRYGLNASYTCNTCHSDTASNNTTINGSVGRNQHPNAVTNVSFSNSVGGIWSGTQCSNTYCHSRGTASSGTHTDISWTTLATNCRGCHGNDSTSGELIATGTHGRHVGSQAYACYKCHSATVATGTSRTIGGTGSYTVHVNKMVDVRFEGINSSGTYSGLTGTISRTPGASASTCGATACHGTSSPVWNVPYAATIDICVKCHGNAAATSANYTADQRLAAPGYIGTTPTGTGVNTARNYGTLSGFASISTNTKVGAHNGHLKSAGGYSSAVVCTTCHQNVVSVTTTSHMDAATTFAWSGLSVTGGLTPTYNAATAKCSTTYCHGNWFPLINQGTGTAPVWNLTTYITGTAGAYTDCDKCHLSPPLRWQDNSTPHDGTSLASRGCTLCHPNLGSGATHINGDLEASGGDNCLDCHSTANLSARHLIHTDASASGFMQNKLKSAGHYGDSSWWYSVSTSGGVPKFSCGYCHPAARLTFHDAESGNTTRDLDLTYTSVTSTLAPIKWKNAATVSLSQTEGSSVVCGSVYCHSNGYTSGTVHQYGYVASPNWYGSDPWGTDDANKCSGCHGNSPTGTSAHAVHRMGIHEDNVFSGTTGTVLRSGATGSGAAHGDPATATTINCNVCHIGTVAASENSQNPVCAACHTDTNEPLKGHEKMVTSNTSTLHVNGTVDVVFAPVKIKTRAQLRTESTPTMWERKPIVDSYKTTSTVFDQATTTLNSSPTYSTANKNCTVSCHNNVTVSWTATGVSCQSCHTAL